MNIKPIACQRHAYHCVVALILLVCTCACEKYHTTLKGCCSQPGISESFGDARLYIPNIFTPNFDHINDNLLVVGINIKTIRSLRITDLNGKVVREVRDSPFDHYQNVWDGMDGEKFYEGAFRLAITVEREDGALFTFESYVCSYPCGFAESNVKLSMTGCQFADQVNPDYQFDPMIPTQEPLNCFE